MCRPSVPFLKTWKDPNLTKSKMHSGDELNVVDSFQIDEVELSF